MFNGLLFWSQLHNPDAEIGKEYHIHRTMLFTLLGEEKSNDVQKIRDGVEKLTQTLMSWNEFNADKSGANWDVCSFLQGGSYRNGMLSYKINSYLEDKIYNPTLFAKIQLCIQARFQKSYTMALYEYMVDELCRKSTNTLELNIKVADLKKHLKYEGAYKHLQNDVLKKSQKDFEEKTDLTFTYVGNRDGRSITNIDFMVTRKSDYKPKVPPLLENYIKENISSSQNNQALVTALMNWGVSSGMSKKLVRDNSEEAIQYQLSHMETQTKGGKEFKNAGGFLKSAIEKDYRSRLAPIIQKRVDERKAVVTEQKRKLARVDYKQEFGKFRFGQAKEKLSGLSTQEQDTLKNQYVSNYLDTKRLRDAFAKDGWNSVQVMGDFVGSPIVQDYVLTAPEEKSFETWLVKKKKSEETPF